MWNFCLFVNCLFKKGLVEPSRVRVLLGISFDKLNRPREKITLVESSEFLIVDLSWLAWCLPSRAELTFCIGGVLSIVSRLSRIEYSLWLPKLVPNWLVLILVVSYLLFVCRWSRVELFGDACLPISKDKGIGCVEWNGDPFLQFVALQPVSDICAK